MISRFSRHDPEKNHYLSFLGLFVLSVVVNYYSPAFIRISFFASLLLLFFRSKDNAFWLAFFWCLNYAPGYLFHATDPDFSLPVLGVPGSGREVSYLEIAVTLILLKAWREGKRMVVSRIFWLPVVFSLVLFILSFILGISSIKVFRTIRFLIPYGLLWALPNLLYSTKRAYTLFNYFLVFTVPIVLCQIYVIFFGQHLMVTLGGSFGLGKENLDDVTFDSLSDLIRPLYSTHILLLNVFYSLYILLMKNGKAVFAYAPLFLILSFLSFLITGTRGYVLASVAMLFLFILINLRHMVVYARYLVAGFSLFFLLLITPGVGAQFRLSLERIFTVQSIIEGDKTAKGTLKRLTERQPVVMAKAQESLIIGHGFSDLYYMYKDGHVANASLLLNGGIIGLVLFVFFVAYLFVELVKKFVVTRRREILALAIGILGFLIVHSTSYMVFSYLIGSANFLAFLLLLSFTNIVLMDPELASDKASTFSMQVT